MYLRVNEGNIDCTWLTIEHCQNTEMCRGKEIAAKTADIFFISFLPTCNVPSYLMLSRSVSQRRKHHRAFCSRPTSVCTETACTYPSFFRKIMSCDVSLPMNRLTGCLCSCLYGGSPCVTICKSWKAGLPNNRPPAEMASPALTWQCIEAFNN